MRKVSTKLTALLLVFVMVFSLVPVSVQAAPKVTAVKSVTLNKSQYVLKKKEKLKLKATISPKKAKKGNKLSWKSSNPKVATVSKSGVVTAKANKGKATITVTAGKKKASCKITIGKAVKKIAASDVQVAEGASAQIGATLTPSNATVKKLKYTVENASVAQVSNNGVVTGGKEGTTKVTIMATDCMKVKKVIRVTVVKNQTAVTPVSPTTPVNPTTEQKTETPAQNPSNNEKPVAPDNSPKFSMSIGVLDVQLQSGDEYTPEVQFDGGSVATQDVTWQSSDDNKVAVVSSKGTIHALTPGSCTITGTSQADKRVTVSYEVTVGNVAIEEVTSSDKLLEILNNVSASEEEQGTVEEEKSENTDNNTEASETYPENPPEAGIDTPDSTTPETAPKEEPAESNENATAEDIQQGEDTAVDYVSLSPAKLNASAKSDEEDIQITLESQEENIVIPEGDFENVTLVVDAPKATIENHATFKQVLIKNISSTGVWCEKSGNKIFLDGKNAHLKVDAKGNPNVYLLDSTESVTITNNGNLQELLIASAAKVVVKSDSIASRVVCDNIYGAPITTYVPLDIYSTTTYKMVVGPGGEQTAIKVSGEEDIPSVSGIGTLSVTVDTTGARKTVIAENDGSIEELPTTNVSGKVLEETEEETIAKDGATVYLVAYSVDMDEDNVSVYIDKSNTRTTETNDDGIYTFEDVAIGNYVVIVEAEGYQLLTQNIYIDTNYDETRSYEVDDIILMEDAGLVGNISGVIMDAETGEPVTIGVTVILRKGINNITTNEVQEVTADEEGYYSFENVEPGQYTIQIVDRTDETEYVSSYENVSVLSDATITRNFILSKRLNSEEVRFVLTWGSEKDGASADLDIHMYGPNPYEGNEYAIHHGEFSYMSKYGYLMDGSYKYFANLDVDDKAYEGPETITLQNVTPGQYKIFVQDFTNGGSGNNLTKSNPVIKVYAGNTLKDTIKMPMKDGGVWFVGSYDGQTGKMTLANEVYNGAPNTTVKAQIGTVLNNLQQFEVTDEEAFDKYQKMIDEVKAAYLKTNDDDTLQEYLSKIQGVLDGIEAGLAMKEITGKGLDKETFSGYMSSHNLYSIYGDSETLPELTVSMLGENTEFEVEDISNEDYYYNGRYRLTLNNKDLGVSTKYYFSYSKNPEQAWVQSIKDSNNKEWKTYIYYDTVYTGGLNPVLGRNLEITYISGVTLDSIEYAEDVDTAKDGEWEYGDSVDAVLHLSKADTGATKDVKIHYIPQGAELISIKDLNNIIVEQQDTSYYSWYSEYEGNRSYRVIGMNAELGDTWEPVVSDGADYTIAYPEDEEYVKITVSNATSGASQEYHLYYYQDTSDAELLGITDKNNFYVTYSVSSTLSSGSAYYNINLSGVNSTLGENLKIHTKSGATAKVEYATASESFEGSSSDAKITITAESGQQRIYYVTYSKTGSNVNIRSINSSDNTLIKVYMSEYNGLDDNTIHISGINDTLGDNLDIATNEGYEATYNSENKTITVTETATGQVKNYNVIYTQDCKSVRLKAVTSEDISYCNISNYESTYSGTNETFYLINLIGEKASCPNDLQGVISGSSNVTTTYASSEKDWAYGESYAAKMVVTDATTGQQAIYLINYKQDDSKTVINGISNESEPYTFTSIQSYSRNLSLANGSSEEVYPILIEGESSEFGDDYILDLPEGSSVESTISPGDSDWPYAENTTLYDSRYVDGQYVYHNYPCVRRVVVKAPNGATRIYVMAYLQDESGAMISDISDEENTYAYTQISSYTSNMTVVDEEGTATIEKVYLIGVIGNNAELGDSYKLDVPEGTKINTITKDSELWNYSEETTSIYYYNKEQYVSCEATYEARIEVTAENGVKRIYVIAYAQDESGAIVSGISDADNSYAYSSISTYSSAMDLEEENDGKTSEQVYLIRVIGEKAELGNTYQLEVPEGASTTVITKGDSLWNYKDVTTDNGSGYNLTYEARIEVEAVNGAKRIYVIAYAQDKSGSIITGISDENNTYVYRSIDEYATSLTLENVEEGEATEENVYLIEIVGNKTEIGTSYKLEVEEDTSVSIITKEDELWNYEAETTRILYFQNGQSVSYTGSYEARIEVTASNGVKRIYVIVYAQDDSGTIVSEISDDSNEYIYSSICLTKDTISLKNSTEDGDTTEEVYLIKVAGYNAELGESFEIKVPEGTSIKQITKDSAEWNYTDDTIPISYYDSNNNRISCIASYQVRLEVTAANGAKRIYVIAYVQDESGAIVSGISDENNKYAYVSIWAGTSTMSLVNANAAGETTEEVYFIKVVGDSTNLGDSFELEVPEGTSKDIITQNSEKWNYEDTITSIYYQDTYNDKYVSITASYQARIELTAKNGAKRIYVVAYAQDESKAVITGISDENNQYISSSIVTYTTTTMNLVSAAEDGETTEKVYLIKIIGKNVELGTTYNLEVPEGTETTVITKESEDWNYKKISDTIYYDDQDGNRTSCTGTYEARIEVTAANGAKNIYVIVYAQDPNAVDE